MPAIRMQMMVTLMRLIFILSFTMVTTRSHGLPKIDESTLPIFLNFPLIYHPSTSDNVLTSSMHCVGENFNGTTSMLYRTCEYHNICYHTQRQEVLYFMSDEEYELQQFISKLPKRQQQHISISSIVHDTHGSKYSDATKQVSIGTVRNHSNIANQRWSPTIESTNSSKVMADGYYQLPKDTILFPIRFTARSNTSLFWLDLFAVYVTFHMLGYDTSSKKPIFLIMEDEHHLSRDNYKNILSSPLWSVFGITRDQIGLFGGNSIITSNVASSSATSSTYIKSSPQSPPQSQLICFDNGIAGLGILATHSIVGRGIIIESFRNSILSNLDISPMPQTKSSPRSTFAITIDVFENMLSYGLHKELSEYTSTHNMASVSIQRTEYFVDSNVTTFLFKDRIQVASTSMIYIVVRSSTNNFILPIATCLPRGATLIVLDRFNSTNKSLSDNDASGSYDTSAIEQEYLSSAGYFQLHWLTISNTLRYDDATIRQQIVSLVSDKLDTFIIKNDE